MAYKMDGYMGDLMVKLEEVYSFHHFSTGPMLRNGVTTILTISTADCLTISVDMKHLKQELTLSSMLEVSQYLHPTERREGPGTHIRSCRRSSRQGDLWV